MTDTERDHMGPDEALAVLRHASVNDVEDDAVRALQGELATLRAQRRTALDLADRWERHGGTITVMAAGGELRRALGVTR